MLKKYSNLAALLTPMTKAYNTEMANRVTYDAVQVHGGTGYMKDFPVERLSRDARITNIYEGTTQLQIIAAIGGMVNGHLEELLNQDYDYGKHYVASSDLVSDIKKLRIEFEQILNTYKESKDADYKSYFARHIVNMGIDVLVSHKLVKLSEQNDRKKKVARSFIDSAFARQAELSLPIKENHLSNIIDREILMEL